MILPRQTRSPHDAEALLGAAEGDAEAGHDFVDDQDDPFLVAELAQPFEEAGRGATQPMLPAIGSTMMQAISSLVGGSDLLDLVQIVVGGGQGVLGKVGGNAGRGRVRRRWRRRSRP